MEPQHPTSAEDADAVDDEFGSLQEGLRTTLPGVTLITAFLLTFPLYDRFGDLIRAERVAYYVAFLSSLLSTVLLSAPSSHQRLRSGDGVVRRHRSHLNIAVALANAGTIGFAVAMTAVAYLVSSLVLGSGIAAGLTAVVATVGVWSWFYLPLVAFKRQH